MRFCLPDMANRGELERALESTSTGGRWRNADSALFVVSCSLFLKQFTDVAETANCSTVWQLSENYGCRSPERFASAWPELIIACDARGVTSSWQQPACAAYIGSLPTHSGYRQTDRRTDITTGLYIASFAFTGKKMLAQINVATLFL